jgi:hypothetical protein
MFQQSNTSYTADRGSHMIMIIIPTTIIQMFHRLNHGRAIAQALSRRLPTAATWVRTQVNSCGICGGRSGTGARFLRVLRFPMPIFNPPSAPHLSSINLDCNPSICRTRSTCNREAGFKRFCSTILVFVFSSQRSS